MLGASALVGCGSEVAGEPSSAAARTDSHDTEPDDVVTPSRDLMDPVDAGGASPTDAGRTTSPADGGRPDAGDVGGGDAGDVGIGDAGDAGDAGGASLTRMNGNCTVTSRPKRLSCPTGMSCFCYESPYSTAKDAPSFLDVRALPGSLEVLSGQIPSNLYVSSPPPAFIPLVSSPSGASGAAGGYAVSRANGKTTVTFESTSGYQPEKYIKYSSADCGSNGETVRCSFIQP